MAFSGYIFRPLNWIKQKTDYWSCIRCLLPILDLHCIQLCLLPQTAAIKEQRDGTYCQKGNLDYIVYIFINNHLWILTKPISLSQVNSADNKLILFFLSFFLENKIWHFMQIVSLEDSLYEMLNIIFWEKSEKCFKIISDNFFLPSMQALTRSIEYDQLLWDNQLALCQTFVFLHERWSPICIIFKFGTQYVRKWPFAMTGQWSPRSGPDPDGVQDGLASELFCFHRENCKSLTLKTPRKPASENVVCWIFLQTFQTYFCIQANSVDPDQTAPRGAVWSGSTLFAKMTFKITSRWQGRRQLLWLAV